MPPTDWQLVRSLMSAAIDACEAAERLSLGPDDRALRTPTGATVWDVLTSSWTYPENVRYAVIRARHDLGVDAAYHAELARPLTAVAALAAELVGTARLDEAPVSRAGTPGTPIRVAVEGVARWYREQMTPQLVAAAGSRAHASPGTGTIPPAS